MPSAKPAVMIDHFAISMLSEAASPALRVERRGETRNQHECERQNGAFTHDPSLL